MADEHPVTKRLNELWNKKAKNPHCQVCGEMQWQWGVGFLTPVLVDSPTKTSLGGPAYPLIPIICGNCGNTLLINLLIFGITEEELGKMTLPNVK